MSAITDAVDKVRAMIVAEEAGFPGQISQAVSAATAPIQAKLDAANSQITSLTGQLNQANADKTTLTQKLADASATIAKLTPPVAYTVSLGQSINAAFATNKTVTVQPGTYSEAVKVPAGCTLNATGVILDGKNTIPQPLVVSSGTVIGIKVINANSPAQNAAILVNGSNSKLQDVESSNNSDTGIDVHGSQASPVTNVTLLRCKALRNGRQGIKGGWVTNSLVDSCESGFNNTAKNSAGGEAGGGKWAQTSGLTIRDYNCHDNLGIGCWLDVKNDHYLIDGGTFTNHTDPQGGQNCSGIQIEISAGPGTVQNGTFSGNAAADVNVCESQGVTVKNCNMASKGGGIWTRNLANRPPQLGPIIQTGNVFSNGAGYFPPKVPA